MAMAAQPDLAAVIWREASATAAAHSIRFTPDCEASFRQLSRDRASVLDSDAALAQAVANTRALVTEMVRHARAEGADALHEWSLGKALSSLCPLFPFC